MKTALCALLAGLWWCSLKVEWPPTVEEVAACLMPEGIEYSKDFLDGGAMQKNFETFVIYAFGVPTQSGAPRNIAIAFLISMNNSQELGVRGFLGNE